MGPSSRRPARVGVEAVTPFLWFNDQAERAVRFYVSLFRGSKVTRVSPGADGRVLTVAFELAGQPFVALNGGPHFALTPAFSVLVSCRTQREVDRLWETLSRGGEKSRCGWLIDRFGLSWQIVPTRLMELLADRDRERAERVMAAMLKMRKIVVADLERAAARS
jgi:predicted 3-demethylubiquinone-9 3-methyltransferase (glyoxalase superfamily)